MAKPEDIAKRLENVLMNYDKIKDKIEYLKIESTNTGRVGATLVATAFQGMSQTERQELIWTAIDANIAPEQKTKIVLILTMTPDEVSDA